MLEKIIQNCIIGHNFFHEQVWQKKSKQTYVVVLNLSFVRAKILTTVVRMQYFFGCRHISHKHYTSKNSSQNVRQDWGKS